MKIHFISLFLISMMLGCKQKVTIEKTNTVVEPSKVVVNMTTNEQKAYFIASGTEPFWRIEIFSDLVMFKTPTDSIKTPHSEPISAMDANVKLYKIETEANQLNIQITQKECINDMSGKALPYAVSVEMKATIDKDFDRMEGCGEYITDYRLHDIWVLESLNGKKITKEDFSKDFPMLEINSSENSFMGFAGCNSMNGTLFFEKDLLRFTNVVTTKMMCEPKNKETEFLKALQSSIGYSIENNRLTLSNPNDSVIVFKKID